MKAEWPKLWQGQTSLDCGEDGRIFTTIGTDDQPAPDHHVAFDSICDRWESLWPQFKRVVTDLMLQNKQGPPDWKDVKVLSVSLPIGSIEANGAEWGVGVVFNGSATLWTVPFNGSEPVPGRAQAMW